MSGTTTPLEPTEIRDLYKGEEVKKSGSIDNGEDSNSKKRDLLSPVVLISEVEEVEHPNYMSLPVAEEQCATISHSPYVANAIMSSGMDVGESLPPDNQLHGHSSQLTSVMKNYTILSTGELKHHDVDIKRNSRLLVEEMEKELKEAKEGREKAEDTCIDLENLLKEANQLLSFLETSNQELAASNTVKDKRIEDLVNCVENATEEAKSLQITVKILSATNEDIEHKSADLEKSEAIHQQQTKYLEQELAQLKNFLEVTNRNLAESQKEKDDLDVQLTVMATEFNTTKTTLQDQSNDLKHYYDKNISLEQE
eukprot:Tbor_TRINITY_DN5907_c0_g1::TRINITY_DN5907_c0_g1_i20::g.19425::m.19425